MQRPMFRFIAETEPNDEVDGQFWRDVDACDRLGSPALAEKFVRALCRARATDDTKNRDAAAKRETRLVQLVQAKGYPGRSSFAEAS